MELCVRKRACTFVTVMALPRERLKRRLTLALAIGKMCMRIMIASHAVVSVNARYQKRLAQRHKLPDHNNKRYRTAASFKQELIVQPDGTSANFDTAPYCFSSQPIKINLMNEVAITSNWDDTHHRPRQMVVAI